MTRRLAAAFLAAALLMLAFAGAGAARTFFGVVGPGSFIVFKNRAGDKVTRIRTGEHRVRVNDKAEFHNFHLKGPGVNRKTGVAFVGKRRWTLTFREGKYRYWCDVHPLDMRGSFRAVNPS